MITFKQFIEAMPLVAVLRGIKPGCAAEVAEALISQGFLCVEVTMNSPKPLDSIKRMAEVCGDRAIIGAGTVTSVDMVNEVADVGGRVIVMPHTDVEVIREAKKRDLICLPGVCTPSDAFAAINAGADGLKIFPAELIAPKVLKSMCAVLPKEIPLLPTGGITAKTIPEYMWAGASGFGLGSVVYKPGDSVDVVKQKAQVIVAAFREFL
ncbi:MAG: 2-dehydro-3-deoxy-6-phosphogalactonate aldolase [Gammaproteobacteria bacterium]|nr:2-dehydro-3-deoxy-6-phosphogalactonate aldolase [Gammaproteobacteria bacterium]MCH9743745.1 2-dehydro-3-deoxy-6-phosphogalactonate aldolase [Gammaproteobacteria bacterium]